MSGVGGSGVAILSSCIWSFSCQIQTVQDTRHSRMDKVVFCLLVLAGICCSSAEVDFEEFASDTTTATPPTTPHTEPTEPAVVDSTSDSLLDLYPHLTEFFTTTTSTASPEDNGEHEPTDENEPTEAPQNEQSLNDEDPVSSSSSEDVCEGELSQADIQTFEKAMNDFSKDLLKQVHLASNTPNVVVSPFSIALGLLQLALGAENQTEKVILEALHLESLQCLHEKLQKVTKRLVETSLAVATRMYVQKGFRIKKSFLRKSERIYGTKPVNLKHSMQQNVDAINKWVKEVTREQIPQFLSNIPSNVVIMLLNAIHFKGIWKNKFDPSRTIADVFYVNDDESVIVDMMLSTKYPLSYFPHDKLDSYVARLPFKGNMSLVVVMPQQSNWNLSKILDNLNRTEIYQKFHKETPTILKIPKLNLDFKLELTHVLTNLGLGQLFSHPDLKGISDEPLCVTSVEHQSTMQLNEEGVEAAAATASVMSRSISTLTINHPFLYFLFDDITGLPLFLGYVRNPKPGFQKKRRGPFKPELLPKGSIPK
ncbi:alpha-2-antiplasmin isoform X1 [Engystomops pustulosus]|uniref:alpha-2-antiplasmin isoform X1 n=1 Tax=Engystomops pustulosus TaxID=76066 RepID=UPI003AFAE7F1